MKSLVFSCQFLARNAVRNGCAFLKTNNAKRKTCSRGVTTLLVVGFLGVFMLVMSALVGYVMQQARYGNALFAREEALSIAESGLEYFKWHVAHNTPIRQSGTGLLPSYTYAVNDPEGGALGTAYISTSAAKQCGRVQWIDVTSVGKANMDKRFPRTLTARYMRPAVAEYAFITNDGVHYVSTVNGPVHGNTGVRMDGVNNSTISSVLGVNEFWCDGSYNCSPSQWKNGVFGNGPNSELWELAVPGVNFSTMLSNTASDASYAGTLGLYLSPTRVYLANVAQGSSYSSVGGSESKGYHIVFNSNGTVTVKRVTAVSALNDAYDPQIDDFVTDRTDISSETTVGAYTYPPPARSSTRRPRHGSAAQSQQKTVIATDPGSFSPDIILGGTMTVSEGNIGYATTDGTVGLTAIAEHAVRYANKVPNDMTIRGTFVAENGFYGRYYYGYTGSSYNIRNSLTLNGSVVTYLRAATWWGDSGFQSRLTTYDRLQAFNPPPFTPSSHVDYGYVLWNEQ